MSNFLDELIECGKTNKKLVMDMFKKTKAGTDILDLAQGTDNAINSMIGYSTLCPTTVELNYLVNNCAPSASYKIDGTDLVSFSVALAKEIPGMKGKYAHTKMAYTKPVNTLYESLCKGTAEACNAGVKGCGVDVPLTELRHDIYEILESYEIRTVSNACGTELYDAMKIVPNSRIIPEFLRSNYDLVNTRMEENEVYCIDVYGVDTSKDVEAVPFDYPSIFYKLQNKKSPHRKSVASAVSLIDSRYGENLFSIYDFMKSYDEKFGKNGVKMNKSIMKGLYEGQYIMPLPCLMVKPEEKAVMNIVARFGHSVHIGAEKTTVLC